MATIHTRIEGERGCGFRKPGGMYMVCDGPGMGCGRLPIKLEVCPCCNAGIKPSRGWTWVKMELFKNSECKSKDCGICPLSVILPKEKVGLLWVGEKFYPTPADFQREGNLMGISKRISQIPKNFEMGKTWVALAHRKGMPKKPIEHGQKQEDIKFVPAVFQMFKPQRIEYVVKGDETEEELDRLEKRGLTLVEVKKKEEQSEIDV